MCLCVCVCVCSVRVCISLCSVCVCVASLLHNWPDHVISSRATLRLYPDILMIGPSIALEMELSRRENHLGSGIGHQERHCAFTGEKGTHGQDSSYLLCTE